MRDSPSSFFGQGLDATQVSHCERIDGIVSRGISAASLPFDDAAMFAYSLLRAVVASRRGRFLFVVERSQTDLRELRMSEPVLLWMIGDVFAQVVRVYHPDV